MMDDEFNSGIILGVIIVLLFFFIVAFVKVVHTKDDCKRAARAAYEQKLSDKKITALAAKCDGAIR